MNPIIQSLLDAASSALKYYQEQQSQINAINDDIREYERQIAFHVSEGNTQNANYVRGQLAQKQSDKNIVTNRLNSAKTSYENALKQYEETRDRLLSEEEKKALAAKEAEKLKQSKVPVPIKQEEKKLTQGTTKYLIIAGIVIAVIIIGLVIIRVYYKKTDAS